MLVDAVTLKQLRALAAVARHGSISAAAEALHLTPPAVHSQIKGLEGAMAATLLQRTADSAGSRLTAAGAALLVAAERVDVVLSQAAAQVRAIESGQVGHVALGVVSTAKYFAPGLVKTLRLLHPGVTLALKVGNRDTILHDLETGAIDLAVTGRPPREPPVEATPVGPHPHGIVAAPDHPLAGRPALSWADLRDETFIAREPGSGTRILMQRYLDRLGDGAAYRLVELGSNETIKQAVIAGLGIAFLSLHTTVAELRHGDLATLAAPQTPVLRHWFLVRSIGQDLSLAAGKIHAAILRLDGSFLPTVG